MGSTSNLLSRMFICFYLGLNLFLKALQFFGMVSVTIFLSVMKYDNLQQQFFAV